jgi:hypothetical protein
VAGHKDGRRPDAPATVEETRRYLYDAARPLATGPSREQFFFRMPERYPARVNPYTLWLSARLLPGS